MTVKAMVQELYVDMKVVRPAVEGLISQTLDPRLTLLENDKIARDAGARAFSRIGGFSNKAVVIVLGVGELALGLYALINHVSLTGHP
jgi:hypothetical protein